MKMEQIFDPHMVVLRAELTHHVDNRETLRGELPSEALLREILGLLDPHVDVRLSMKIIN